MLRWKRSRKLPSFVNTLAALGRLLLAFTIFDEDGLEVYGSADIGNWGCGVEPDSGVELEDVGVETMESCRKGGPEAPSGSKFGNYIYNTGAISEFVE